MTRTHAAAAAVLALVACGDKKGEPSPTPPPATFDAAPAGPGAPLWTTTIDGGVGTVVAWGGGPARVGDVIVVASDAFGVAELDPATGAARVQNRADEALIRRRAMNIGTRMPGMDPDLVAAVPIGGDSIVVLTRSSVARFPAVKSAKQPSAVWEQAFDERAAVGVAGPVLAGDTLITVVDETLVGRRWDSGAVNWRAPERYASAPGSIAQVGDTVRVVAIDPAIGPASVDPRVGKRGSTGEGVTGVEVLAAGWSAGGALVAVVRLDTSLRNDAVVGFRPDGTRAWTWKLPSRERADHVGVLIDDKTAAAYVFYDGNRVSKFPLPVAKAL